MNLQTIFIYFTQIYFIIIIVSEKEQKEANAYKFPPLTKLLIVRKMISAVINNCFNILYILQNIYNIYIHL